jgi:DNA primase
VAGRIRPEDIEAVRERTDIVAVISGYLQLKKAGGDRLVGLCPFHAEKTASLSVSPSKQLYYCFGCGEGGNVFTFLVKLENLTFAESVERLADAAGFTLRYEGQNASDRRTSGRRMALHRVIAEAASLYQGMLVQGREAADARGYIADRGISQASVERFGIGYAPGYPDYLLKRLSKTYSPELLIEAGLVTKDDGGNLRDRFRGRVMFPIHDLSGSGVGFGGRLLAGPNAPANAAKYVNSPETPLYHKGTLLYNLNRAKADITRTGRAFLVEGYTDVIALDQAGVTTGVATCGTALGEDHIRLLSRFAPTVVLAFDSDEAGARAAERAYQFHQQFPVSILVLVLPQGQDPADFALAHGDGAGAALEDLARRAVPLVEYMIRRLLRGRDLGDSEEKARAIHAALPIVAGLDDDVRRRDYAMLLAEAVDARVDEVLLQLDRITVGPLQAEQVAGTARRLSPSQEIEREALKLLLQAPELCPPMAGELDASQFATPGYRAAFELIREARAAGAGPSSFVRMPHDRVRGDQLGKLLAALAVEEPKATDGRATMGYAEQIFLRLKEFTLKRQADDIRKQLERLNPLKAAEEYDALYEQFVKLEGARRRIRAASEAVGSSL